jgi:hypothetical protein
MNRRLLKIAHILNLSEGKSNDHLLAVRAMKLRTMSRFKPLAWRMYGGLGDHYARPPDSMSEMGQFGMTFNRNRLISQITTSICEVIVTAIFSNLKSQKLCCGYTVSGSFSLYSLIGRKTLEIAN